MANWIALNSLAKGTFQDTSGNALQSRTVNVYLRGTTTQATVAPNNDGTGTPLTQPLVTNATGDVPGYIFGDQAIDFYDASAAIRYQAYTPPGYYSANVPAWTPNTYYPVGFVVVQGGILYSAVATFTSGTTFNATNWVGLTIAGTEVGAAQITSASSGTGSASLVDVSPAISVTATAPSGSRPWLVEFTCRRLYNNITNGWAQAAIIYDGTQIGDCVAVTTPGSGGYPGVARARIASPSAGSHVIKIQYSSIFASAGTAFIDATAASPALLTINQV